jgi:hypothetical protein
VAEELVAAADGEQRCPALDRLLERVAFGPLQILRDGDLLLILAAAEEEDIDLRRDRIADADLDDFRLMPAPARPLGQGEDVAPVAVDVHL